MKGKKKLPGLLRQVPAARRGDVDEEWEPVPAEDLVRQWEYSSCFHFMLPTAAFHRDSLILRYNGARGREGHFTLLYGPGTAKYKPAERMDHFLRGDSEWLPSCTGGRHDFSVKPVVFDTVDFLSLWEDRIKANHVALKKRYVPTEFEPLRYGYAIIVTPKTKWAKVEQRLEF